MCGFYGLIQEGKIEETQINDITSSIKERLKSRGPDNFSTRSISDFVFLAHSRLSIQDTSRFGNQPFVRGNQSLVFNGEIYNFKELKKQIIAEGSNVNFSSHSDTEVLFYYLSIFGINRTLESINGMFSFCFIDLDLGTAHFAVDKFGQKPLYYRIENNEVEFGSFPFLELSNKNPKLDLAGTLEYFRTGNFPIHGTVLNSINRLNGGNCLCLSLVNFSYKVHRYAEPVNKKQNSPELSLKSMSDWACKFEELVDEYTSADVPMAALVSGGLDSACLMVALSKLKKDVTCITADTGTELSEVYEAQKIARYLDLHHEVVSIEKISSEVMTKLVENMPQPLADPAIIPLALLAQSMRTKGIKVGLLGDGGDEMFYGYESHYSESAKSKSPISLTESQFTFLTDLLPHPFAQSVAYRFFGVLHSNFDNPYAYHCHRTTGLAAQPKYLKHRRSDWSTFRSPLANGNCLQSSEYGYRIPNRFAPKLDISGMSHSTEFRVPFLDSRLVAETFSRKLHCRTTQVNYLRKNLDCDLIAPKKRGLGVNLTHILKKELRPWVEKVSQNIKHDIYADLSEIIDFKQTLQIIRRNEKFGLHSKELYPLLIFLEWWRKSNR